MTDKIEKHVTEWYDYHEMVDYVEKKYEIKVRDYSNRWGDVHDSKKEYQDFWHWMLDTSFNNFQRGAPMELDWKWIKDDWGPSAPEWVNEILDMFIAEFPEKCNVIVDW